MEKKVCVICGEEFEGYGNNAEPYAEGICCDECNALYVIPARINLMKKGNKEVNEDLEPETEPEVKTEEEPAEDKIDLNNVFNSLISDKFSQISELKGLCATEGIKDKPEIVEILKSVIDDLSIHVGQYQEVISYLDGNYQDNVEKGKDKAQTVLAAHEAPVEEDEIEDEVEEVEPVKESIKPLKESKPTFDKSAIKERFKKLSEDEEGLAGTYLMEGLDGEDPQEIEVMEDDFDDEDLVSDLVESQSRKYSR